jgi:iron complex outermembrane recepter protein
MTSLRALTLGLLASTAIASPALAENVPPPSQSPAPATNATDVTAPPPKVQQAQEGQAPDQTEIVITATKREEFLQNVPQSVIALGTRKLDQLNISNFEQYTKQLPSVSWTTSQSGGFVVYMRGVAASSSGEGNHSGTLPSVGVYLDEQPVTTIGGALDVHIYDIARIESLAGPQGTLYGASSEAGTIRIITNKPDLSSTYGRMDAEINHVAHGGVGGKLEGMINIPIASRIAFRGVAFWHREAGYIDNVPGSFTFCGDTIYGPDPNDPTSQIAVDCVRNGITINNANFVKKNINSSTDYGGRAALKIDLDDNWTVTPTIMHQESKINGFPAFDPTLGDLKMQAFRREFSKDKFTQAALTVEGKIWNFDLTYAGAYMDRPTHSVSDYTDYAEAYDQYYQNHGGLAYWFYYQDAAGNTIDPQQYIVGSEHFKKLSQEIRLATPQDWRARAIVGAFYQVQKNHIFQDYLIDGLAPDLSVNGWPGTLWLTLEDRKDKDYALFGEGEFDVTPQLTLIAGGRLFKYDNSLFGFAGFGKNPNFSEANGGAPPNGAGGHPGVRLCLTVNGTQLINDESAAFAPGGVAGTPCTNVGNVVNGRAVPRESKGNGFTHRLSVRYKPQKNLMFYATWSRGFRPGGINRQPNAPAYQPDYLTNYEVGWKTEFGHLTWNGALYHQIWKGFQFSFLGPNSLTVIQNGRNAKINGLETDMSYVSGGLTLSAAAAYTDAKTSGAICHSSEDATPGCTAPGDYVITPSGTRLPVTPKFKGTTTARYTWPIGIGKAHVQGSVSYQGSASVDTRRVSGIGIDPNSYFGRLHAFTLVDLFAGYDWGPYNAELFVNNVFDKRNELARFARCGDLCQKTYILPGTPRTIGVRVGTKF